MNILFGIPSFQDWRKYLQNLPYNIYFQYFTKIKEIIKYIKKYKIDIIVPISYNQMEFVIKYYKQLSSIVKKIICGRDINIINLLDNKDTFYKRFNQYVPNIYIIKIGDQINYIKDPQYPCIYKLTRTFSGIGSFIINSKDELDNIKSNGNYIVQQYISSPFEYSGHFYVKKGLIKFFVYYMMTNYDTNYIQHGRLTQYVRITEPKWLDVFGNIFNELNYTGFTCIDFKVVDDRPVIFEINPRLGGSIVCSDDLEEIMKIALE